MAKVGVLAGETGAREESGAGVFMTKFNPIIRVLKF